MTTRLRLVVFDGLDAPWCKAHPDVVAPLWDMAAEGCSAVLRSCSSPITPMGAAAVLTGREIDVSWTRSPSGDAYASAQDLIRARPWVVDLDRAGLKLGMCNVPLTWPAFRLPGLRWMTSGYPVQQGAKHYQPRGLDMLGYPIGPLSDCGGVTLARNLQQQCHVDSEIVRWFLTRPERCDVEIIWLMLADAAAHRSWDSEAYTEAVRTACAFIPRLREGADNVVVLSDHGADGLYTERCEPYMVSDHGPAAVSMGLVGGHTMDGVLVAAGDDIHAAGELPEQRLVEVAAGVFDVLGLRRPAGMVAAAPAWAAVHETNYIEVTE